MGKIKNYFISVLMRTKLYKWLMEDVLWRIRFTTYYALPSNPNFPKWGALKNIGRKSLQAGDIILTVDDKKLTTKAITLATATDKKLDFAPSHAAICVSKDGKFEVAEMTHTDFTKSTWDDVCFESTRVLVLRCKSWSPTYIKKMLELIPLLENVKYDQFFKMGIESLSCSELPYAMDAITNYRIINKLSAAEALAEVQKMASFPEAKAKVNLEPVVGDEDYISPLGWYLAEDVEIIWDSDNESNN